MKKRQHKKELALYKQRENERLLSNNPDWAKRRYLKKQLSHEYGKRFRSFKKAQLYSYYKEITSPLSQICSGL